MNTVSELTLSLSENSLIFFPSYLVTHINNVQALVIVEHTGGFYNLYLSDEAGVYYSLSLRDLVVERNPFNIDLELVRLPYIMILIFHPLL